MRMLLKVNIPVETGNAAVHAGALGSTIQRILAEMKPESAYFIEEDGERTGYIVFDMQKSSELPRIAEPWFLAFNASLTVRPAMKPEDLMKASPSIERAVNEVGLERVHDPDRLVIIPDCGHLPQIEQPEATAAALAAWLRN